LLRTDDICETFNNTIDVGFFGMRNAMTEPFSGERSDLTDLHPGRLGQEFFGQRVGQWKAGALRLAGNRQRNHRTGMAVEHLMAEHQDWTPTGLFSTFRWLEVGPVDIAP